MVLIKMKIDLQNIINIGHFLEKYIKTIQSCIGFLSDLQILYDPLVLVRNVISNILELLIQEMDVAQGKRGR